jgi:hypothetical protein
MPYQMPEGLACFHVFLSASAAITLLHDMAAVFTGLVFSQMVFAHWYFFKMNLK